MLLFLRKSRLQQTFLLLIFSPCARRALVGAAITIQSADSRNGTLVSISDSTFFANMAYVAISGTTARNAGDGGALHLMGFSLTVTLTRCTFRQNIAGASGGAVFVGGARLVVLNCTFVNCAAARGGALMLTALDNRLPGRLACTGCRFALNLGTDAAGAVFLDGDYSFRRTVLSGNLVQSESGSSGSGGERGGALVVAACGSGSVVDSQLANNTARDGGAVYQDRAICGGLVSKARFVRTIFDGNTVRAAQCSARAAPHCRRAVLTRARACFV